MAEFPALPLFTDAWIADTKHLTRAERGLYHDLLVLMWRSPGCKVPKDEAWLAKRLNITENTDAAMLRAVYAEFCAWDANWLWQKRLLKEYEFLKRQSKLQSDRAKSRWNKEKDACRSDAASGNAASGNAPTPTPTPTYKNNGSGSAREAAHLAIDLEFNLTFWPAYPVKAGRKEALKAFHAARAKVPLEAIMAGLNRYVAVLASPHAPKAKYAQGWLNGERWADETVPTNGALNGHGHRTTEKQSPHSTLVAGFGAAIARRQGG